MSLPSGYTRLEYIESSGTQYIDTGVKANQDSRVKVEFMVLGFGSGTTFVFGAQTPETARYTLGLTSAGVFRSDFGSQMSSGDSAKLNTWYEADKNGNVCTIGSGEITSNSETFTGTSNIYLFARSYTSLSYSTIRMRSCKIYNGSTLIRDLIPCKNASGVVGLWDDVNSVFYTNAGSGTFVAGAEIAASHKTLIGGTAYDVTGGNCLIGGTGYQVQKGRTLIGGTGYDIVFPSVITGTPLGDIAVRTLVKLNESGAPVEFYVAKHNYESGLNGTGRTLLVRKDCYDSRQWNSSNANVYASSAIDSWLNSTYKNLLDADIRGVIGTTKIKYTPGNGSTTVGTLERAVFLLSVTELGRSASYANTEGTALDIASSLQIAYLNGSAVMQWTRSPNTNNASLACYLQTNGNIGTGNCVSNLGARPAFTLPADILVDEDMNIIAA